MGKITICTLKPLSKACASDIEAGAGGKCAACQVSMGLHHECNSNHSGATIAKKATATANALSAKNKK
jgi:hypothetical protein